MVLGMACSVLLAATPAGQMKLASPGLGFVGIDQRASEFFSDYFARQLDLAGIHVTTEREIEAVLGLERQKNLLGCSSQSSSSCLAELAGALGVDGVITGTIAKTSTAYAINLKIVSARDGSTLGVYSTRVKDDDALLDWLAGTARAFASQRQPNGEPSASSGRALGYVVGSVGVASVAAGAVLGALVLHTSGQATTNGDYSRTLASAQRLSVGTNVLYGVGAVGVAAGIWLFWRGRAAAATPTVFVAPSERGGVLVGRLEF